MKRVTITLLLLFTTTAVYGQSFIYENGIIKCDGVEIGSTGTVFGEIYEAVDRELLIQRRDEGEDLTKVCVSNVTDMSEMFKNKEFNQQIASWDVSNVTNMYGMFRNSSFNQPISNWDVSNVTTMGSMFESSHFNLPINNWDVSNVTSMHAMFSSSQFDQPINNWDVSNLTSLAEMFSSSQFNQPINNWDVSNITIMSRTFFESQFNQPIDNWDVSNVTDMTEVFYISKFNQPIGNWDVSNVTKMHGMFQESQFNQNISGWCVTHLSSEPIGFSYGSPLFQEYKPVWGTCPSAFQIPPVPTQIAPLSESTFVSLNPTFVWNSDSLSTHYQVQLYEGFDPLLVDTLITDTLFVPTQPLLLDTDYYWRVKAINDTLFIGNDYVSSEWSPFWKFTTTNIDSYIDLTKVYSSDWNLVSLPVEMEDTPYPELFPSSVEGTLYGYNGIYVAKYFMSQNEAYWIKLSEQDSVTYSGERILSSTVSLQPDWNLIGGITELSVLDDPNQLIIPGTLYGFDTNYTPTETIESGRGYWVASLSEGDVFLTSNEETETPTNTHFDLRSPSILSRFQSLDFFMDKSPVQQIYFGGSFADSNNENDVNIHPLQTKLPPIPPKGSFDVRTTEGSWITEESQIRIRIQQTDSPVEMVLNGEHLYEIQFLTETLQPIGSSVVVDGSAGAADSSGSETSGSSEATGASISSGSIAVPASAHWMDIQLHELEDPTEIPSQFSLAQNYPNPFNPSTRIEFSLPASVPVKLSVYTVTGQLVSTLVNEPLSAGTHSVSFDGSSYPSGVYLYRLQTPSFTQSKLMNLIK